LSKPTSQFNGLFVATLTPFDANNRIDFGVLRAHTQFLIEGGVNGLSPCGTTGEFLYLSIGEKVRVIEAAVLAAKGRVPVMAGIWAPHAKETALLARAAESAGASAVFLQPPIYYPASDDIIVSWYSSIHNATTLPVFAYNIPAYAANSLGLDCVDRLVEEGIIVGIKDSSGSAERIKSLVDRFGKTITVMAASDSFATQAKRLGAHGFISALANVWPNSFAKLWAGDSALQSTVDSVRSVIKKGGGVPALKRLASLQSFSIGESRLPGVLSEEIRIDIDSAFHQAREAGLS
jgi:4-hydroxy-tetrahydrodipicolinate synthase